jgi:hypothetical protein
MIARPTGKQKRNRRILERPTTGWLTHLLDANRIGIRASTRARASRSSGEEQISGAVTLTFDAAGRSFPARSVANIASAPTGASSPLRSPGRDVCDDQRDRQRPRSPERDTGARSTEGVAASRLSENLTLGDRCRPTRRFGSRTAAG